MSDSGGGAVAYALRERVWPRRGAASAALAPAAALFRVGWWVRRAVYATGVRRAERVAAPVVGIGNLTVGGTGKTPAALWLATRLRDLGFAPAIVTRGYGGALGGRVLRASASGRATTPDEGGIEEVGDEAVLLAARFPGPVVCGVDRVAAARSAIADHGADVVVLDDGFQHWRLARDLDVVLVDGRHGFGNGALLPAGPLREPLAALRRAGAVVSTKRASADVRDVLARRVPAGVPVLAGDLVPRCLVGVDDGSLVERPLADLMGRRVVTVSGLARPESFYELLGQLEVRPVEVLEFPDHHRYVAADWQRINHAAHAAEVVVCTEKDLVKLRRFPFARGSLTALRVDFALAPADEATLLALVRERVAARRAALSAAPATPTAA
ncbi:MAG TPA: tetraacyldisaccharide 4'-kinase [Candidatus Binatia bacterium]|nr:tetraacyldisaccharide 4'-kinase [Candidatus Binatia bacterium]